jgi:hypothetical protein
MVITSHVMYDTYSVIIYVFSLISFFFLYCLNFLQLRIVLICFAFSTVLYCTVLCCTVLYCTVLYCTVLCCTILYYTILYCAVLSCTVLYCTVLYCTVLCCAVLCCSEFNQLPFFQVYNTWRCDMEYRGNLGSTCPI